MMLSTSFQKARATKSSRIAMRIQRITGSASRGRALLRVGGRHALEGAPRGLPFGALGRERDDLLPRFRRPGEILLAERHHDALVEQRLRVRRVDLQRVVELLERAI